MKLNRRQTLLGTLAATAAISARAIAAPFKPFLGPRARVMIVNDISGDVDGLFSTVHALLSPSTEICGIIGTGTSSKTEMPVRSAELAREILKLMGLTGKIKVFEGVDGKLASATEPRKSPGVQAIIDEAMRTDSKLPLYITVGGGLTEVASALLLEPKIADKFTLVWIGGGPYPVSGPPEYNFNIDRLAAQHVFNETAVPIWQVTSDAYGQCVVSNSELQAFVAPFGEIGAWLYKKLLDTTESVSKYTLNTGETWTLGDSPLVLLTALTSWVPSMGGGGRKLAYERTDSRYDEIFAPKLGDDGSYTSQSSGRKIRVYTQIDTRLMFGDFFAKMRMNYGAGKSK
jgi:purine nucleosidase